MKKKEVGSGPAQANDRGLGLEVPSMFGSPGPVIDEFSHDPEVKRKRSGESLFADPQYMGRRYI